MLEIELKLRVESLEPIAEKLSRLGAEFDGDFIQVDSYYDDSEDSLVNSDRCLRIRKHRSGDSEVIELTYKGARENHRFKTRREVGLKVEKAEELAHIFQHLGYKEKLTFEKKRSLWDFTGCKIALDELPLLGRFVEIEGPNDALIENAQKQLGLGHLSHIPQSYAHLMEEAIKKTGIKKRKITFDTKQ